jgi:hypothetical protein
MQEEPKFELHYKGAEYNKLTNRHSCKFDLVRQDGLLSGHAIAGVDSPPLFETAEEAAHYGARAVLHFQAYDKLPNLCERW